MKQSQDPSGRHAAEYINSMNWTEKYVAKERMIRLILKEEWMFGLDLRNVGFQLYHPHSHAHAQEETHEQDGLERTFRMKDLLAREDMRCDPSSFLTAAVLPFLMAKGFELNTLSQAGLHDFAPEPKARKPHKHRNKL